MTHDTTTLPKLLSTLRRLTPRDRALLNLLDDHQVLTTSQVADLLFGSLGAARRRLRTLEQLDLLTRYATARANGSRTELICSLGPVGEQLRPQAVMSLDDPPTPAPARRVERVARLAASPRLPGVLAANGFFAALTKASHAMPDAELLRWWSPRRTAAFFNDTDVRPDGHGLWRVGARTVGFFLQYDTGEASPREVLDRLDAYRRLACAGPRYSVLLWVPDQRRARLLLAAIGYGEDIPVAVGVQGEGPAGSVWRLASERSGPYALHELPSHPGRRSRGTPSCRATHGW
ncbi:replication-relaxation family protein [Longispora sp. NPDC051575]|uniref:replication-relaxation family protein n=1 Tax=Longispora sp. NPDC051575 TaxID=3154943 RepID=UPI003421163A